MLHVRSKTEKTSDLEESLDELLERLQYFIKYAIFSEQSYETTQCQPQFSIGISPDNDNKRRTYPYTEYGWRNMSNWNGN